MLSKKTKASSGQIMEMNGKTIKVKERENLMIQSRTKEKANIKLT